MIFRKDVGNINSTASTLPYCITGSAPKASAAASTGLQPSSGAGV